MSSSSLVSGISVHVPSRKRRSQALSFDLLVGETENSAQARHEAYDACTSKIEAIFQTLLASPHKEIVTGISSFISDVTSSRGLNSKAVEQIKIRGLPTAIILGGIGHTDHNFLFDDLVDYLKEKMKCHWAFLNPEDCPNMKLLMKKFVSQLLLGQDNEGDEKDDEEEEDLKVIKLGRNQYNFSQVITWYREYCAANTEYQDWCPIIIILKDVENFLPSLIQDFIEICNHYCDRLPLVFVFGLSTGSAALQKILSQSIISMLYIKEFNSSSTATSSLAEVAENLFIHPQFPFRLGNFPLFYLIEQYRNYTLSLQSLHTSIKFAALEHFSKMPLSFLCTEKVLSNEKKRKKLVFTLSKAQLKAIKSLESFQRYVNGLTSSEKKELSSEKCLKNRIAELVGNFLPYSENFYVGLKCLMCILKEMPSTRLGSNLPDLCLACSSDSLMDHSGYANLIRMIKQTSESNLVKILKLCMAELDTLECVSTSARKNSIVALLKEIKDVKETSVGTRRGKKVQSMATETTIQRKMRLQERLRQSAATQKEPQTRLDKIRLIVSQFFDQWFRESLQPLSSLPLHEIISYQSEDVAPRLDPSIRRSLHVALSQPEICFFEPGRRGGASLRHSSSPDVCVAYKLYLECGKLINLFDWLQAFAFALGAKEKDTRQPRRNSRKRKADRTLKSVEIETEIQARFIRAVSELQFMGFIKPTKRKTDHVQRMTWNTY